MPSSNPTGFETYIYSHKDIFTERRSYLGQLHDPEKLPLATCDYETGPLIMVEPSYAHKSTEVFLHFRAGHSIMLDRYTAEQLRDALIKVCQK